MQPGLVFLGDMPLDSLTTDALLQRLEHHPLPVIDLSLERIRLFLGKVGYPERDLPPVVHIAGTNGKGSVLAMMRAILEAAGYRVHSYTSPHLVRFHERIRLYGDPIKDDVLRPYLRQVLNASAEFPLTFFESTTVAAFLAYRDHPADVLLLETGLGGRLDATNLIQKPLLTVLTPVGMDHMEFLGSTLADIAREKAGIIKPGVICVSGEQAPEALAVIAETAASLNAPFLHAGRDWHIAREGAAFHYRDAKGVLYSLACSLHGAHQSRNAGIAIAACRALAGFTVSEQAIRDGLKRAEWPARLQRLLRGPLAEALPDGARLWLDGGHNPAAAAVLAAWCEEEGRRPALIWGMMKDKDAAGFIAPLAPYLSACCTVAVPGESRAATPDALSEIARDCGIPAMTAETPEAALRTLLAETGKSPDILIAGSLYLAGYVLQKNA